MKTILAHIRKDVRCLRSLLWGWLLCVGIIALALPGQFFPPKPEVAVLLMFISVPIFCFQWLLLVILIVQAIQLDPLTEADVFWRTRPISRPALLAEKALFVLLLSGGAALCMAAVRFQPNSQMPSAMNVPVFIVGLVAFATVTSGFLRLVGIFLGLVFCASLVRGLVEFALKMGGIYFSWDEGWSMPVILYPGSPGLAVFYLVGFAGVIVHQYLTLRTNLSRWMLFAILFLGGLLQGNSLMALRAQ